MTVTEFARRLLLLRDGLTEEPPPPPEGEEPGEPEVVIPPSENLEEDTENLWFQYLYENGQREAINIWRAFNEMEPYPPPKPEEVTDAQLLQELRNERAERREVEEV